MAKRQETAVPQGAFTGVPLRETLTVTREIHPVGLPKIVLQPSKIERDFLKVSRKFFAVAPQHWSEGEALVYLYLYWQSHGFGYNYCRVGYSAIQGSVPIRSRTTIQQAVKSLQKKRHIIPIVEGTRAHQRGTLYRVLLPEEIESGILQEGIPISGIPESGIPTSGILVSGTPNPRAIPESGIPPIPESGIHNREVIENLDRDGATAFSGNGNGATAEEPVEVEVIRNRLRARGILRDQG